MTVQPTASQQLASGGHRVGDRVAMSRVVVVRKQSAIEKLQAHPDAQLAQAVHDGTSVAQRVVAAHAEHQASLVQVERVLQQRGLAHRTTTRLTRRLAQWADLVVTVGGDGTFLSASHSVHAGDNCDGPPMLGINSAPSSSIGYFCASEAAGFARIVEAIGAGQVISRPLWRMQVAINGTPLRDLALNDVLLAHRVPAETSRYVLQIGELEQDHKSSGLWIATAAGSTAAIRSAGGAVLPIESRALQYRVRELMTWAVRGEPLQGGQFDGCLTVVSRMLTGALYIDGGHLRVNFGFGDKIAFSPAPRAMGWIAPPSFDLRRAAILAGVASVPT